MKKTIAYILIAVVALGAIYYLYNNKSASSALGSVGGSSFAKDDEAAYNEMRTFFNAGELAWIDDLVKTRWETNPGLVNGQKSKARTFLNIVGEVAPNPQGKYPPGHWTGTTPLLFPGENIDKMWKILEVLTSKHNKL